MLVTGLGLRFGPAITIPIGGMNLPIDRLGVVFAVVFGLILNAVLKSSEPDKIPTEEK
jgi:hypothetical protein